MKTINLNFNGRELPTSLGFGILDNQSIRVVNDILYANYVWEFNDSIMHQVEWSPNSCRLNTIFNGKVTSRTQYPTLEKALLNECVYWNLSENPCYHLVSDTITSLGNIYVNHPALDKDAVGYYPAGKIFIFSLPILQKNQAYLNFLTKCKTSPSIRFFQEKKGHILVLGDKLVVHEKPITIAQFIVPLAKLVSASKLMIEAQIIENEKYLRLIINDSFDLESILIQCFSGDTGYSHFAICYHEFEQDKLGALSELFLTQTGILNEYKN